MGKVRFIDFVDEFTAEPGGRLMGSLPSGEEFREWILVPAIRSKPSKIVIDFDGTFGILRSFLEEVFGGLTRPYHGEGGHFPARKPFDPHEIANLFVIISEEDPAIVGLVDKFLKASSE